MANLGVSRSFINLGLTIYGDWRDKIPCFFLKRGGGGGGWAIVPGWNFQ